MNIEIFQNPEKMKKLKFEYGDYSLYLNKKTKRDSISDICVNKKKRCDICLEYERYSNSPLISCINCRAPVHSKCIQIKMNFEINLRNKTKNIRKEEEEIKYNEKEWQCNKCVNSIKLGLDLSGNKYDIFFILLIIYV